MIVYDADGNRISKKVGTTTTLYLVDTHSLSGYTQVLEELTVSGSTTNLSRQYTYGLDLISQRQPSTSTNFFGYDGLGSTRFLANSGGTVVNSLTYDAYGTLIASNAAPLTAYLFAGEQWDADLGLYYERARYLKPNTGRFWTMDSFEGNTSEPLSLHKYLYAHADPVNRIDPSGHENIISVTFNAALAIALKTIDAVRGAPALISARAIPFLAGGTAFITTHGHRSFQYLQSFGVRGINVLQMAFQRSTETITRSQALESKNWATFEELKAALNPLVNAGSRLNPDQIRWHHIIEQTRGIQQFGGNAIHSMANVVPTPTAIHTAVTRVFASSHSWLPQFSTLRDYVSRQTWERQYEIGLRIWQHAMETGGRVEAVVIKKIVLGE